MLTQLVFTAYLTVMKSVHNILLLVVRVENNLIKMEIHCRKKGYPFMGRQPQVIKEQ